MELLARTCKTEQMNWQRLLGRVILIAGGVFWVAWIVGARFTYQGVSLPLSLASAIPTLVIIIVLFVLSLYYERLTAFLLFGVVVATLIWGIVGGWEAGVWGIMLLFYALPPAIAGVMFLLAARMQDICELKPA